MTEKDETIQRLRRSVEGLREAIEVYERQHEEDMRTIRELMRRVRELEASGPSGTPTPTYSKEGRTEK